MISKQEFFQATNGYDYVQHAEKFLAYSDHAMVLDVYDDGSERSAQIVFDAVTDVVYFVGVYDYINEKAYALVADGYDVHDMIAYDGVKYTILEVNEDWIEKTTAIFSGLPYDDRIKIQLHIDDDCLFQLMKMAHELDITLNEMISLALVDEINRLSTIESQKTDVYI